jgi:hypothetical protein
VVVSQLAQEHRDERVMDVVEGSLGQIYIDLLEEEVEHSNGQ